MYQNNRGYKYSQKYGGGNNKFNESNEKITCPLHEKYKDSEKMFLEDGIAHSFAKTFVKNRITSHQLRKILDQSKICEQIVKRNQNNYGEARKRLFSLLPLAAYNAGRESKLKPLYKFLSEHVNEKTITCIEDIDMFDDLFTSIVAYHKFEFEEKKSC